MPLDVAVAGCVRAFLGELAEFVGSGCTIVGYVSI